jgi:hypothetical protein
MKVIRVGKVKKEPHSGSTKLTTAFTIWTKHSIKTNRAGSSDV